jgi:catechol 2,3-dioxygenase-like lactoylglutathione lyase family enzyme
MIRTRGIHHLALVCKDMQRTVDFYTNVLGMNVSATLELENGWKHFFFDIGGGAQLAFFAFPGGREGQRGEQYPGAPSKTLPSGAMHHVALMVESVDDLSRAREELRARGVRVSEVWDHEFCKSIYFTDPDGIQIELSAWVRAFNERDVDPSLLRPAEERERSPAGDLG